MADQLLGGIAINEVLVDPNGTINYDTDGNGTADATDEYIELVNMSDSAIDISGLQLWDGGVGNWFTFPSGTILQPGAHAMVMTGVQTGGSLPTGGADDLYFDAGRGSALINNGGDNIIVYDPANDEYIAATFNGDTLDNPTAGAGGYAGFSSTATQVGSGEDFGFDVDGESLQRVFDDSDFFILAGPTPGTTNVCFADGTSFSTTRGRVQVEDLSPGDKVITLGGGTQTLRWVYGCRRSVKDMHRYPNLAPVRIARGALGPGLPERLLRVSQQHRILVQGPIARRMFGSDEVMVAAKHLTALTGVTIERPSHAVTYFHLMFYRHEVLIADGVPAESLYLGPQALKSLPRPAIAELECLLGTTLDRLLTSTPVRARPFAEGRRVSQLIERHVKNRKPILLAN